MLTRTLEPEVMDTVEEAVDYDSMDHSEVNRRFVDDLLDAAASLDCQPSLSDSDGRPATILDVGTGTALIPLEFFKRPVRGYIVAIDLAVEMLKLAEINIRRAGLHGHITLEKADGKALPYRDGEFDCVISNSILHHIPEPRTCLAEMLRVLKPGGLFFVRDLLRPTTAEEVEHIVRTYAGEANAHQQQLFRQSLRAALTIDEVRSLLSDCNANPDWVTATSDRHWTIRPIASK